MCKKCRVKSVSKQTIAMKLSFFGVMELVIKRLITNMVQPEKLLTVLPSDIASQLRLHGCMTIHDIFKASGPLDKAVTWYDCRLLLSIVNEFGDQKSKQEMNGYIAILEEYLQSRTAIGNHNTELSNVKSYIIDSRSSSSSEVMVLVDPEWGKKVLEGDSREKSYIASLLGTNGDCVQFTNVLDCQT